MQNRLAHRLAGNGSGVDADAADHGLLFHHGHCFPDFRGLNGGSLPTGAGADDYKIKRSHLRNPEFLRRVLRGGSFRTFSIGDSEHQIPALIGFVAVAAHALHPRLGSRSIRPDSRMRKSISGALRRMNALH